MGGGCENSHGIIHSTNMLVVCIYTRQAERKDEGVTAYQSRIFWRHQCQVQQSLGIILP